MHNEFSAGTYFRFQGWHRWFTFPNLELRSFSLTSAKPFTRATDKPGHHHDESASEVVSVLCDGRESTIRLSSPSPEAKDSQHLKPRYSCPGLERVARSFKHSASFHLYVYSSNSARTPSNTRRDRDPPARHARRRESTDGLGLSKGIRLKNRLLP